MQKQLVIVSVAVLVGSIFMPYAQAMDIFFDQFPQYSGFAKPRPTLEDDINGLYRVATPLLHSSDDNAKIQVAIKICEVYWHRQTDPALNKRIPDFQFIADRIIQGVSPEAVQIIKSRLNFLNFEEQRKSTLSPEKDTLSAEKNTLSPESLAIIRPLFKLYKDYYKKKLFKKFKTKIGETYREIPTTLYPTLEELLKALTTSLENIKSEPNNANFKKELALKKRNLNYFCTPKKTSNKRPRTIMDKGSSPQKKRRVSTDDAFPMEEEKS